MAVQTISYDDKSYLNQNSSIAAVNKVNDTDMNEIKSVVNNNASEVTTIENYFTFTNTQTITTGTISGGGTLSGVNMTIETNAAGTLAKMYGQVDVASNTHSGNVVISTSLRPTSQLTIMQNAYRSITRSGNVINNSIVSITIGTNGDITIPYVYVTGSGESCRISFFACPIIIKNIGS